MAEQTQPDLATVHGLKKPVDYEKRLVCSLTRGRWTVSIKLANEEIFLTPKEARLVGIAIRREQRIQSSKRRQQLRKQQRQAQALGV